MENMDQDWELKRNLLFLSNCDKQWFENHSSVSLLRQQKHVLVMVIMTWTPIFP